MGKSTHCTKVKVCMLKYALPLDIEYFPEIGVRLESRGQAVTALCGQAGRAMRSVRDSYILCTSLCSPEPPGYVVARRPGEAQQEQVCAERADATKF